MIQPKELIIDLSKSLKEDRFYHVLGVANTAASMAMRYGIDMQKAYLAGLLHDTAKAYKKDSYIEMCEDAGLSISDSERMNPQLLHAKLGAYIAKEKYQVTDKDILDAITYHTTGRPGMSSLEKIIYIADYIEPGRTVQKNLDIIRKYSFEDFDKALELILKDTIDYLKEKNFVIDNTTIETYEYYCRR